MQHVLERYGVGIVVGSAVTVGLLYLMQAAITSDKNPINEAPDIRTMDIVRLMEDIEPKKKPPAKKPPPPPDQLPPDLPRPDEILEGADPWHSSELIDPIGPSGSDVGPGIYSSDGEYLPLNKVQPDYPRRALQRGIEGYVIVEFTVTENGKVEDPFVYKAEPPGIFDRAALQAALKFSYRPRVVDGIPIRVNGVRNKITFELEDEH